MCVSNKFSDAAEAAGCGVCTLRPTGPEFFFLSSPLVKEGLEEVTDTASWSRDEKP